MTDDHRQRMNVRAIRVSLASALRHATPNQTDLCLARARQLLDQARHGATGESVLSEIRALESELQRADGVAHEREG